MPRKRNDDTVDYEQIDQDIRINELKERAFELSGGKMATWESGEIPGPVSEQFWSNVVAFEESDDDLPTHRRQLEEAGIDFPEPEDMDDKQVHAKVWEIVRALAERRVFLTSTNHLSDRELYEKLLDGLLDEENMGLSFGPGEGFCGLDVIGSGSEEDIEIQLRYYSNDESRKFWKKQFPKMKIPPKQKPPYDRDRLLPQAPF